MSPAKGLGKLSLGKLKLGRLKLGRRKPEPPPEEDEVEGERVLRLPPVLGRALVVLRRRAMAQMRMRSFMAGICAVRWVDVEI